MRFAAFTQWVLLAALTLAGGSCTIIQDSDITDPAEFENLKLKSIVLDQDTNKGKKTTSLTLLYDSAVKVTDPATGSVVVRKMMFNFPNPGNLKVKLRSGSTAALQLYCSYLSDNKPYTAVVYEGDSAIEIYRFRYNTAGKVNKIITTVNPNDNKPFIRHTRDSLIYSGSNVTSIVRTSPDASLAADITIGYGGSGSTQSVSNFRYGSFNYGQTQGDCPNGDPNVCTGYNLQPTTGSGGFSSYYTVKCDAPAGILNQLYLADTKIQGGQSSMRDYDTYYFHPLMILRNQVPLGNYLFVIYAIDWLEPGPALSQTNFTRNEFVTFNLIYAF